MTGGAATRAKGWLEALPGAVESPARFQGASLYKVQGKLFAILELRAAPLVIVKCDPELVPVLLETYTGVGHRSHLDRRFWVSVKLDADVPARELKRLIEGSYALVCAGLTRKQRAELTSRRAAPRAARDRPRSA